MLVTNYFQPLFLFDFLLVDFSDLKLSFFFFLNNTVFFFMLLPANHIWPVKSQEVGYAHVVVESKTKQTSKPQPLPAENSSSDPWQYYLGRCCCCSQAWSAAVFGQSVSAEFVEDIHSGGTILPQEL